MFGCDHRYAPSGDVIDVVPWCEQGYGLEQILQYYGISCNRFVAFGDSMNDYAMPRYAGTALRYGQTLATHQTIATKAIMSNTSECSERNASYFGRVGDSKSCCINSAVK